MERDLLIPRYATGIKGEGEPIHFYKRFLVLAFQGPIHFQRTSGFCNEIHLLPFGNRRLFRGHRKFIPTLHDRTDQRLMRLLILKFQPHPIRRPRHFCNAHFVKITNKIVVIIPTSQPQARRRFDVELRRGLGVEFSIDIETPRLLTKDVRDMHPLVHRQTALAFDV